MIDLLKMKHARLMATAAMLTAQANRETAMDGWCCDWATEVWKVLAEAQDIEAQLAASINVPEASDG